MCPDTGSLSWVFEKRPKRCVNRDPFEAEFFAGEGDSREAHGRTDSLVREVLQNSLDARLQASEQPVRVRFTFRRDGDALPVSQASTYLDGLVTHLRAIGNNTIAESADIPPMPYMVIEDFGTRGLSGDPARDTDPDRSPETESFWWFWRNVGRSGKCGTNLGRWGLGKTVFPSASGINAFWGLTVRACDGRRLLMGQAITKAHRIDGVDYEAEGFYCDPRTSHELQMPFETPEILDRFSRDFGLARRTEPGLSVVVPYPAELFTQEDIARSVIVHFFIPIMKRQLIVEISGTGLDNVTVERSTIRDVSDRLSWPGSVSEKKHSPPPFDLADWAIQEQVGQALARLELAGANSAPQWSESLFPDGVLSQLQRDFGNGQRVSVRIPMTIEKKKGPVIETYFDAFLESNADVPKGEDYFVRDGMTISKISTLAGQRGVRGLVLVDDPALSALLGDVEGPAHMAWGESEKRPDEDYNKWRWRVRFVKNSLARLLTYLSPLPANLSEDLLQHIFAIDDPAKSGARQHKKKKKREKNPTEATDTPPPEIPPAKPQPFQIEKLDGNHGFAVVPNGECEVLPMDVRLKAAYDVPTGNPFSSYSRFDFSFENRATVRIAGRGIANLAGKANIVQFRIESPEFRFEASGFDPLRDLVVNAEVIDANETEE